MKLQQRALQPQRPRQRREHPPVLAQRGAQRLGSQPPGMSSDAITVLLKPPPCRTVRRVCLCLCVLCACGMNYNP